MLRKLTSLLATLVACAAVPSAEASEGAATYYFAGGFGSFLVAVPTEPGLSVASQTLLFQGNTQRAVLNGRQTFGLQAFALFDFLAASYTFEQPLLGGRLQLGAAVPVIGYASMGVSLQTQRFGTFSGGSSDFGIGDSLLTPFSLAWNFGDFNAKLIQYVVVPTGHYDTSNVINTGRNYWAFDTQLGLTCSTRRPAPRYRCCRASCSTPPTRQPTTEPAPNSISTSC